MKTIFLLFLLLTTTSLFAHDPIEEPTCEYKACAGDANFDQVIKENSSKPIIYGVGAAGITFDTSFTDSKKILTQPSYGPTIDGEAVYNEQIFVRWRTKGAPRTPMYILTFEDYLGKIQIKKPVGQIDDSLGMGSDLSSYMGETPKEGANQLAIDLYQALTGTEENCIDEHICNVEWGDEISIGIIIHMPGMIALFTKDDFTLDRAFVIKPLPTEPIVQ